MSIGPHVKEILESLGPSQAMRLMIPLLMMKVSYNRCTLADDSGTNRDPAYQPFGEIV